jgi:hypothetical protein
MLQSIVEAPVAPLGGSVWVPETQFVAFKRHPLRDKLALRDRIQFPAPTRELFEEIGLAWRRIR